MMNRRLLVVCWLALLASCFSPPIGVKRLGVRSVHEELTGNVLTTGRPSPASWIVLQQRGLAERWTKDPSGTLAVLNTALVKGPPDRDLVFALTELSFAHAIEGDRHEYYLAAAVYGWGYLFDFKGGAALEPLDPRPRLAADIYNIALARAFETGDSGQVVLQGGPRRLPFNTLDITFDADGTQWSGRTLVDFRSASELSVHGLRNRYRTWGIGAPLNAATQLTGNTDPEHGFVFRKVRVPVTLLLRPDPVASWQAVGPIRARLELVTSRQTVDIEGQTVPLEYEPTSALAQALADGQPWKLEFPGFLGGNLIEQQKVTRLGAIQPFQPDKIPVVLVHGTASSLMRWAEMLNDLANIPEIRQRFQFWLFSYDSGNPILYSALQLREALEKVVHQFDPAGTNACVQQMVLIGHSQGGLLVKLMVVESGDRFWQNASDEPFAKAKLSPSTRELLQRAMFFSPLPFVREVVFISTPHGGSYQAGNFVRRVLQRLVNFPTDLARAGADVLTGDDAGKVARQLRRMPTSVDNMAPNSPFVKALASLPVAPGVSTHSIIPVLGNGPLAEEKDGIVAYTSAHIEPVDSELVVRNSGHSTQGDPRTIEEVRRILLEHAGQVFEDGTCRAPAAVAR